MWCTVALELSILFASWHTLLAGNLSKSTPPSLKVLDTNSSSHKKNQKMSLWRILAVSGGVFSQIDLCLHCIIPFIYAAVTLPEACEKVKAGLHLI